MQRCPRVIVLLLTFVLSNGSAHAVLTNLVTNGTFENPTVVSTGASDGQFFTDTEFDADDIWSTQAGNDYELFSQGLFGSPATGSDGNPTGQHLEVRSRNGSNAFVGFTVTIPDDLLSTTAIFTFDSWWRDSGTSGNVFLFSNGAFVGSAGFSGSNSAWNANSFTINGISTGLSLGLFFQNSPTSGNAISGLHIDDVELLVDIAAVAPVPEPAFIGTSLLFLFGLASIYRKQRWQASRSATEQGKRTLYKI